MRARLSARDRRALVLGAAVVVPALVWMFAGAPYVRALGEARARLDAERDLLARELELVASAPAHLADAERATQGLLNAAPRLFAAANDGPPAAMLADYVRLHAREARVHIASVAPVEAEQRGARLHESALVVTGESDLEGLLTLLARLEAGRKLVRVDGLSVDATRSAAQPGGVQPIAFRFTVVALVLPEDGTPARAEAGT